MRAHAKTTEILVAALLAVTSAATAQVTAADAAARPGSAIEAIRQTSEAVIRVLSDTDLKRPDRIDERRRRLVEIIGERFSYEEMSKRTLGTQWTRLSEQERHEFVDLFKGLLAKTYADKIDGFAKEQVQYLQERVDQGYAEVRTRIVSDQGTLPLDFRLMDQSGEWRVYDVVVDGISLVNNYRGQFSRILSAQSYPQLLAKLREKSERQN